MKSIKSIVMAVMLTVSVLCLSFLPTSASVTSTSASQSSNWRIPVGSFIQDYMTYSWSDERWQEELSTMKDEGMNILIFSPSLIKKGDSITTIYPTKVFTTAHYNGIDCIDACLRNCEKAGVKVFIALNQDPLNSEGYFWSFGGTISDSQPDVLKQYWANNAKISNELADELYSMYKSKYPNAFYGWYWVHEFWNYTIITNAYEGKTPDDYTAADPSVYTNILANDAFNPVLDHLTQIDSSMPMLFSSFYNPGISTSAAMSEMWKNIFQNTHFRSGDIWAPMDGMGGSVMTLNILGEWTAAAKKATEANSNLHFWINNELQVDNPEKDDEDATLDRAVQQFQITSKYAEQNVTFSWNHFYSPYNVLPGYNEVYKQYIKTGSIEKNAPSAVDAGSITVTKYLSEYIVKWKAPYDDVGVCKYNIYKNGKLVAHIHPYRQDSSGCKPGIDLSADLSAGTYEIEAIDFAGNVSPKTSFTVSDNPVTTTTASSTSSTNPTSTTNSTSSTNSTSPSNPTSTTVVSASTTGNTELTSTETAETTSTNTKANTSGDIVETTQNVSQTEQTTAQSPATGSTLPKAALVLVLASAGLGFAMKAKKEHK